VGEACRLPDDDPDARASLATRRQVLDLAVVEAGRRHPPILGEHLGEVAACPERSGQHASQHSFIDHEVPPPAGGRSDW